MVDTIRAKIIDAIIDGLIIHRIELNTNAYSIFSVIEKDNGYCRCNVSFEFKLESTKNENTKIRNKV